MKASIWTVEGRLERIGKIVTESRLNYLRAKRDRQCRRLADKYKKINAKKTYRFEARIS
jgi:hypothetical protein